MIDSKLIPKGQIVWESTWSKDGVLKYFITSDQARTKYNRYDVENGVPVKTSSAKSPLQLRGDEKNNRTNVRKEGSK